MAYSFRIAVRILILQRGCQLIQSCLMLRFPSLHQFWGRGVLYHREIPDENFIVGGRLTYSLLENDDEHQIILPIKHILLKKESWQYHLKYAHDDFHFLYLKLEKLWHVSSKSASKPIVFMKQFTFSPAVHWRSSFQEVQDLYWNSFRFDIRFFDSISLVEVCLMRFGPMFLCEIFDRLRIKLNV